MSERTIINFTGNGTQTLFTFTFDYLQKAFVKVQVDGIAQAFTFHSARTINIVPAPAVGTIVTISRQTSTNSLVTFVDGSILLANELNIASLQAIHIAGEAFDIVYEVPALTQVAMENAIAASDAAISASNAAVAASAVVLRTANTIDALVADVGFSYTAGANKIVVSAGDTITTRKGSFTYLVVAAASSIFDFVTAGGVKFNHVDGPIALMISGQSNATGSRSGGPNPASFMVKTWDGITNAWGGSDYTGLPWSRPSPHGNSSMNNVALARAHYLAEKTGRRVYIIYDAVGGTSIDEWVALGTTSARYVSLDAKATAALATIGKTAVDEIIWAQGEEDYLDDFATHLGNLTILRNQFRAAVWCRFETPIYFMAPSKLHERYQWSGALHYFCNKVDNRCIVVPSKGLRTDYDTIGAGTPVPATGDYTHFSGDSLWEAGYTRIAAASPSEGSASLFFGRGTGPAAPTDPTVLTTFSSMVSKDSWTAQNSPTGVAATGSITWGMNCSADGNYCYALGDNCVGDNLTNYTILTGRNLSATATGDYGALFGEGSILSGAYSLGAGRGHVIADDYCTAIGAFSKYITVQTDPIRLQVGTGTTSGSRKNGFAVRTSGILEADQLPTFDTNAAALTGSLVAGQIYKTSTGELRIVI